MLLKRIFDPRKTTKLFELSEKFNFFKDLIARNKLPKVILLTGNKGVGKLTGISFNEFYFDKKNYDINNNKIIKKIIFLKIYLKSICKYHLFKWFDFKNVKIDDIRDLKSQLLKLQLVMIKDL